MRLLYLDWPHLCYRIEAARTLQEQQRHDRLTTLGLPLVQIALDHGGIDEGAILKKHGCVIGITLIPIIGNICAVDFIGDHHPRFPNQKTDFAGRRVIAARGKGGHRSNDRE